MRPRRPFFWRFPLLFGLGLAIASCGSPGSPAESGQNGNASPGSIELIVGSAPDYELDITLTIVDSTTSAVIFNQSYPLQSTPLSVIVPADSNPLVVTVSILVHLVATAAIFSGTNSTAGTTLTDMGHSFSFLGLPLFVVDSPSSPTTITNVLANPPGNTLTLSQAYPLGTYYLFRTQGVGVRITRIGVGTDGFDFSFPETQTTTQTMTVRL